MEEQKVAALFSRRLVRVREQRNMTVTDLAEKARISYQTLWRIEQKQAEPGIEIASRLARILHCSLDYLCGLYDEESGRWPAGMEIAWQQTIPGGLALRIEAPVSSVP